MTARKSVKIAVMLLLTLGGWASNVMTLAGASQNPSRSATNPYSARQVRQDALKQARINALKNLLELVGNERVANDSDIRVQLMTGDKPFYSDGKLLKGVEELPAKFYDDRTCEVTLRLSREKLQENLDTIATDAKAANVPLALGLLQPRPEPIEAVGASKDIKRMYGDKGMMDMEVDTVFTDPESAEIKLPAWPPTDLSGWGRVTAYQRLLWEQDALAKARANVAATISELDISGGITVKAFLERDVEITGMFAEYLASVTPSHRAYYSGGIVEVKIRIAGPDIFAQLQRLNYKLPKEKRLDSAAMKTFEKAVSGQKYVVYGYAGAGKDPKPPTKAVVLTGEEINAIMEALKAKDVSNT